MIILGFNISITHKHVQIYIKYLNGGCFISKNR